MNRIFGTGLIISSTLIPVVAGRRYYDAQFEPRPPSPRGTHQQPSPGPIVRGRSAGDLVRPAYHPGSSDRDQPMYTYRPDPTPFGYERTVDDRPVSIVTCIHTKYSFIHSFIVMHRMQQCLSVSLSTFLVFNIEFQSRKKLHRATL